MKKSRKIISMPIISIVEGVQIGSVKGLVVNPAKKEVAALIVDQKGWFREEKIIPYSKVSHVGDDAITIDQSGSVEKTTNLPEILKLLNEKPDPIGMKVISEKGKNLGFIDEYYIDEETGAIVAFEISGKFIEGLIKGKGLLNSSEVLTMGSDAVVVKTDTEGSVTKIDGGLQETLSNFKENTSSLWSTTRNKTAELSKTLGEKSKTITEKSKTLSEKTKEKFKSLKKDSGDKEAAEEAISAPPLQEENNAAQIQREDIIEKPSAISEEVILTEEVTKIEGAEAERDETLEVSKEDEAASEIGKEDEAPPEVTENDKVAN